MHRETLLNPSEWADTSLADEMVPLAGVILFDGACRFCRRVINILLAVNAGASLRLCSVRSKRGRALATELGGRPEETFALITADRTYLGVSAYEAIFSLSGRTQPLAWLIAKIPAAVSRRVYRWVASHRPLLSALLAPNVPVPLDKKWFIAGGEDGSDEF